MPEKFAVGSRHANYIIIQELVPVEYSSGTRVRRFQCRCVCGATKAVMLPNLGRSKACSECRRPDPLAEELRKLSREEVAEVRRLRGSLSQRRIAARFNVSQATVNKVLNKQTYKV